MTSHYEAISIASRDNLRKEAVVPAPAVLGRLNEATDEVIELRPWIRATERGEHEGEHLEQLLACTGHGEREHVLSRLERMAVRQTFDVVGIVEIPFALGLHEAGIILTQALQARATNGCRMSPPVGGS